MSNRTLLSQIECVAKCDENVDSQSFNNRLAELQEMLGQDDGGIAGAFFPDEGWPKMPFEERVDLLVRYVKTEIEFLSGEL